MSLTQEYQYQRLESTNHIRLLKLEPTYLKRLRDYKNDSISQLRGYNLGQYRVAAPGHSPQPKVETYEFGHVDAEIWTPSYPMPGISLEHVDLDDAPDFEAISYTWGSPDRRHFIDIQGQSGKIALTDNLALALPYLAVRSRTGYLWIDQICIDQANLDEKSVQISLMGTIFRDSRQILVWLDPGNDLSSSVDLFYHSIYHKQREAAVDEFLPGKIFRADRDVVERYYSGSVNKTPWFTRGWCVQEFVLANSVLFVERTRAMLAHEFDRLHDSKMLLPSGFQSLFSLRNLLRRSGPDHMFLLSVLDNYGSHFHTTQPQDRVFAFLGLWSPPNFVPDYKTSITEVFRLFVLCIAISTGHLDFLACARALSFQEDARASDEDGTWPSWVPRWRCGNIRSTISDISDDDNDPPEPFWTSWERFQEGIDDSASRWYRWRASKGRLYKGMPNSHHPAGSDSGSPTPKLLVKGRVLDFVAASSHDCPLPAFGHDTVKLDDFWTFCMTNLLDATRNPMRTHVSVEGVSYSARAQFSITGDRNLDLEILMNELARRMNVTPDMWSTGTCRGHHSRDMFISRISDQSLLTSGVTSRLGPEIYRQNCMFLDREFPLHIMRFCRGRSVFRTEHQRIGLAGPLDALDDETIFGTWPNGERKVVIAIIHGCSVPLLLLRQDPATSSEEHVYQVLTECYLHGAMYGEAVDWEEDEADTFILV